MGKKIDKKDCNRKIVLYVIGKVAPTSVALEVARHMDCEEVGVGVVSFYETEYQAEKLSLELTEINAKGRFDLSGVWRLLQCVISARPNIIHVHHTVSAFWSALFGKLVGAKIVRTEHSNSQFHTAVQRAVNTVSRGVANRVLCNSKNTYRGLSALQRWLLGDRYRVVYNGVDAKQIEQASCPPPFEEKSNSAVTVGSVGRLIEQKNYKRLLRAFSRVVTNYEGNVRLVLVGDGENRPQIEREIRRLGLREHVTLTGEVEREKVYSALRAFDIFVMPSLSEGFCNAVVEAMASGLPLLCSDIPTLREVAGDAVMYADPNDSFSISKSLLELLREGAGKWEEWGRRARKTAKEKYSVEKTAQKYIESYIEL